MSYHSSSSSSSGPISVDGYYPLYTTSNAAEEASPDSSGFHTHTFDGTTYYMPNGLVMGETQFHGDYSTSQSTTSTRDLRPRPPSDDNGETAELNFTSYQPQLRQGRNSLKVDVPRPIRQFGDQENLTLEKQSNGFRTISSGFDTLESTQIPPVGDSDSLWHPWNLKENLLVWFAPQNIETYHNRKESSSPVLQNGIDYDNVIPDDKKVDEDGINYFDGGFVGSFTSLASGKRETEITGVDRDCDFIEEPFIRGSPNTFPNFVTEGSPDLPPEASAGDVPDTATTKVGNSQINQKILLFDESKQHYFEPAINIQNVPIYFFNPTNVYYQGLYRANPRCWDTYRGGIATDSSFIPIGSTLDSLNEIFGVTQNDSGLTYNSDQLEVQSLQGDGPFLSCYDYNELSDMMFVALTLNPRAYGVTPSDENEGVLFHYGSRPGTGYPLDYLFGPSPERGYYSFGVNYKESGGTVTLRIGASTENIVPLSFVETVLSEDFEQNDGVGDARIVIGHIRFVRDREDVDAPPQYTLSVYVDGKQLGEPLEIDGGDNVYASPFNTPLEGNRPVGVYERLRYSMGRYASCDGGGLLPEIPGQIPCGLQTCYCDNSGEIKNSSLALAEFMILRSKNENFYNSPGSVRRQQQGLPIDGGKPLGTHNPISKEQRQYVEGYLAWKYGIYEQLPEDHPYRFDQPNEPVET